MFGLFTWLRNRRARRANERARLLFPYFDGTKLRRIDPMRAWREIQADKVFNIQTMCDLVDKQEEPETTYCLDCLCRVFGVTRFDDATGGGLTDGQLLNLLVDFEDYLDRLQKKTRPGQTLPSPTEAQPLPLPAVLPEATKPLSGSGSMSSEPRPDTPTEACAQSGPLQPAKP